MASAEKAQVVLVCLAVGAALVLGLAAEAYFVYRLSRYRARLARDGVRVPGVVTRVSRFVSDPADVSVRYAPAGAAEPVEGRFAWGAPTPVPAVGDTVTVVYLPGVRRSAELEANVVSLPWV